MVVNVRTISRSILFLSIALYARCSVTKTQNAGHINLKQAYYQSWILNENEKGTDIVLELSNVPPETEFRAIVFRGHKIPITKTEKNELVILKGILITGLSKINLEIEKTQEPDQLIYSIQGEEYSLPLKNIQRKEMRYH